MESFRVEYVLWRATAPFATCSRALHGREREQRGRVGRESRPEGAGTAGPGISRLYKKWPEAALSIVAIRCKPRK